MERANKQLTKTESLKRNLISCLKDKSLERLITLEAEITMEQCVMEKKIIKYKDKTFLIPSIVWLCTRFMESCFPEQNPKMISLDFASDLIIKRQTWSLLDVVHFFKFIRTRQDLEECRIFGNTITLFKLNELTGAYELHRCDVYDAYMRPEEIPLPRVSKGAVSLKEFKLPTEPPDEKFFEKK